MYPIASLILKTIYLLLPLASAFAMVWSKRRDFRRQIAGAWISGTLLGAVVLFAFTFSIGGSIAWQQVAITLYVGVSLMLFLKAADFLLRTVIHRTMRRFKATSGRLMLARAIRLVVFTCFALPWVMSALMVYRPRVVPVETPENVMHVGFSTVHFKSRDGTRLAGWWIDPDNASNTTVLLCHGLGSNKAGFLQLIEKLHDAGFGILAIDLRAHGESGGQISTFGAKESLDALAAVDWLKNQHPRQTQRIIGIGASMGAAALIDAAARDERFDGIVTLGTFDTLPNEVRAAAVNRLFPPVNWLVRAVGLPMASLQAGVDLSAVRPIDHIADIWPRPVFIIHGTEDEIVPFALGQQLYNAAYPPRESMWIQGATHNGVLENADVIKRIIQFIRAARPVPVI